MRLLLIDGLILGMFIAIIVMVVLSFAERMEQKRSNYKEKLHMKKRKSKVVRVNALELLREAEIDDQSNKSPVTIHYSEDRSEPTIVHSDSAHEIIAIKNIPDSFDKALSLAVSNDGRNELRNFPRHLNLKYSISIEESDKSMKIHIVSKDDKEATITKDVDGNIQVTTFGDEINVISTNRGNEVQFDNEIISINHVKTEEQETYNIGPLVIKKFDKQRTTVEVDEEEGTDHLFYVNGIKFMVKNKRHPSAANMVENPADFILLNMNDDRVKLIKYFR